MNTKGKIGVLIVNLGTPDSPGRYDVYKYLKQFLLDKRVIDIPWIFRQLLVRGFIAPFRSGSSGKLYQKLWTENGSPLKYYGEQLVEGVKKQLGEEYVVELAMRYQNPSIPSAIEKLNKQNINELIVLPLFPHYASASTGSVHEEVMRIVGQQLGAWEELKKFEKPFISFIGLKDNLLGRPRIQEKWINSIPGAKGQNHEQFENANHFIQEDIGEIMADRVHKFIEKNPL